MYCHWKKTKTNALQYHNEDIEAQSDNPKILTDWDELLFILI